MIRPRYPIYIPSKGRHDVCLTAQFLMRDGVPFHVVVEPQERDRYAAQFGDERLLVLPFGGLGRGSIPARNWIWEHARASGAARHWILDDNIDRIARVHCGRRLTCASGPALAAVEDFTERYENVAIAGLAYWFFGGLPKQPPIVANVHIYSSMLIQTDLSFRWRARYNEDADLCLQVLAAGLCTVLTNVFLIDKRPTMTTKGGNTTDLYSGDGRLKMARSLERAWPGVVSTTRKFKRPQHHVKDQWRRFDTPLKLKAGVDLSALSSTNEYGLVLTQAADIKHADNARLLAEYQRKRSIRHRDAGIGL